MSAGSCSREIRSGRPSSAPSTRRVYRFLPKPWNNTHDPGHGYSPSRPSSSERRKPAALVKALRRQLQVRAHARTRISPTWQPWPGRKKQNSCSPGRIARERNEREGRPPRSWSSMTRITTGRCCAPARWPAPGAGSGERTRGAGSARAEQVDLVLSTLRCGNERLRRREKIKAADGARPSAGAAGDALSEQEQKNLGLQAGATTSHPNPSIAGELCCCAFGFLRLARRTRSFAGCN